MNLAKGLCLRTALSRVALILIGSGLLAGCQGATPGPTPEVLADGWRVVERLGDARYLAPGASGWSPAIPAATLPSGSRVATGAGGRVILARNGDHVSAGPGSRFSLPPVGPGAILEQHAGWLRYRIADFLVLDNVKRSLGLYRVRAAATGAAPIAPDLIKWYMALGIDMREVYGQTENCGLATAMPAHRIKLGTVGVARPGTEVRLSPAGEILLKGPHVFLGYYKSPAKTAETVIDGWLHTGDVGEIDADGFVRITDRMKDIIITAGGKNVTPSEIENQLKFSPFISDAVVIGDQRKFLSCLVMIDPETVAQFAQERNVPFTDFASLCRAKEVQDLIWAEIERVNRQLARVETIKTFRLIEQILTPEDEELTPTMKLKRSCVNRKYKDVIDGMYERSER